VRDNLILTLEPGTNADGLWQNCRDSIAHALEHFWAMRNDEPGLHHKKWIVLSVHHAAEVFVNFLVSSIDPIHPREQRFGRPHYPSLRTAVNALPQHEVWQTLGRGEQALLAEFFPRLSDARDTLMHRIPPQVVDVSPAAIALLGLLQMMKNRLGERPWNMVWQTTTPEEDVLHELDAHDFPAYAALVEQLLLEYYPASLIDRCPHCGAMTRTFGYDCEACFRDSIDHQRAK
jgi:hypothetical protein